MQLCTERERKVVTPERLKPRGHGDSYEMHAPHIIITQFTAYTNVETVSRPRMLATAVQSRSKANCACVQDARSYKYPT
jgi:hypothetical protein